MWWVRQKKAGEGKTSIDNEWEKVRRNWRKKDKNKESLKKNERSNTSQAKRLLGTGAHICVWKETPDMKISF